MWTRARDYFNGKPPSRRTLLDWEALGVIDVWQPKPRGTIFVRRPHDPKQTDDELLGELLDGTTDA
tara:strand:- start:1476 stop:1673 length:198 start_codon:yes stop_codon:yes gene_type:complete